MLTSPCCSVPTTHRPQEQDPRCVTHTVTRPSLRKGSTVDGWSVKLHSLKRKRSKRAAGPRHGLVDVAGAPLLEVEADLLRRVLLLRTARRSADVGHRLGWRLVRCRRGGRGQGSRRGGSLRIALGLALARDNLPPAERAARHRVVVVGKGARGEGLSTCTATPTALSLSPAAAPLAAAVSWAAVSPPFAAPPL